MRRVVKGFLRMVRPDCAGMAEEKWKFFEKTLAKYPDRVYSVEENKIPHWGI